MLDWQASNMAFVHFVQQQTEGIAMIKINSSRKSHHPVSNILILTICGIALAGGITKAADSVSSEAAIAEMKEMFGGVPTELQLYPESARAAGWAMMKSTDLNENTVLPSKVRELIGLAVSAQIPCEYCVYYHIKAAKAAGASQEEIREAVHQASLTRHWSTILYGNQYSLDAYKSEIDAAFK
jgi:AhpD family alkylhydroperoxidase